MGYSPPPSYHPKCEMHPSSVSYFIHSGAMSRVKQGTVRISEGDRGLPESTLFDRAAIFVRGPCSGLDSLLGNGALSHRDSNHEIMRAASNS